MIKDKKTQDYFYTIEEFIKYLGVKPEIEKNCSLSLKNCITEQDYVDFGNEYEITYNEGVMTHEYTVV